jgi:hypothetical protein
MSLQPDILITSLLQRRQLGSDAEVYGTGRYDQYNHQAGGGGNDPYDYGLGTGRIASATANATGRYGALLQRRHELRRAAQAATVSAASNSSASTSSPPMGIKRQVSGHPGQAGQSPIVEGVSVVAGGYTTAASGSQGTPA